MLSDLTGLSSGLRMLLLGALAAVLIALGGSAWLNLRQAAEVGGLEAERDTLTQGLQAATEAYGEAQAWSLAKDQASARALAAARAAGTRTTIIKREYIDHAANGPLDSCPALDAALDGLRHQYPDDPGGQAGARGAAGGADGSDPGGAHSGAGLNRP